ncbi:MAG TPA: sugar phosphate isomerase/epimerase [Acidimicrobiales bacterium]|nr:sugar phosphate isomerase/epimerase [Acidimicrobiales bacterium]
MSSELGFGDLVLCPATLGSPSLEVLVQAASAAGFQGVDLTPEQILDAQPRLGALDAVKRAVNDAGLRVTMGALKDWINDPSFRLARRYAASRIVPRAQVFELAEAMGVQILNVTDLSDIDRDWKLVSDSFASVCDEAAQYGIVATIEFCFGRMMNDLDTTARIIEGAGRENGGILLDTFHYHRGPVDGAAQLERHASRVRMLHVSDTAMWPWSDQRAERQHGRLLPGTGTTPLIEILRAVRDAGRNSPIGVEINNDALHAMPPVEAAKLAAAATRSILERVAAA